MMEDQTENQEMEIVGIGLMAVLDAIQTEPAKEADHDNA